MKKVLFVSYLPAVGSIYVNETFRTAFGMYAEDVEPSIILMMDSVVALNEGYSPERIGLLTIKTVHRYLKRYGTRVYAVREDLESRRVDVESAWNVEILKREELSDFFHSFDTVIFM